MQVGSIRLPAHRVERHLRTDAGGRDVRVRRRRWRHPARWCAAGHHGDRGGRAELGPRARDGGRADQPGTRPVRGRRADGLGSADRPDRVRRCVAAQQVGSGGRSDPGHATGDIASAEPDGQGDHHQPRQGRPVRTARDQAVRSAAGAASPRLGGRTQRGPRPGNRGVRGFQPGVPGQTPVSPGASEPSSRPRPCAPRWSGAC